MAGADIRPASDTDVVSAQRIAARTIRACYPAFLGEQAVSDYVDGGMSDEEIAGHRERLFVMTEAGEIVGFTIIVGDLIHLLMVDVASQRQGLGSTLLRWSEEMIRESGCAAARLETFAGNAQANALYLKNGWVEQSRDGEEAGTFQRLRLVKFF